MIFGCFVDEYCVPNQRFGYFRVVPVVNGSATPERFVNLQRNARNYLRSERFVKLTLFHSVSPCFYNISSTTRSRMLNQFCTSRSFGSSQVQWGLLVGRIAVALKSSPAKGPLRIGCEALGP